VMTSRQLSRRADPALARVRALQADARRGRLRLRTRRGAPSNSNKMIHVMLGLPRDPRMDDSALQRHAVAA
jgi:hypothetical protein